MGWLGITRGITGAGADLGTARDAMRDDQMKMLEFKLKLQQLQQQMAERAQTMQQRNAPVLQSTFQDELGNLRGIEVDPNTGQPRTVDLFKSDKKYPKFTTPQQAMAYALQTGDQGLLKQAQDAIRATQKPNQPTPFSTWAQEHQHDLETGKVTVEDWVKLNKKFNKGSGSADGLPPRLLESLSNKWAKEGIKPPAKYQAAVEQYMEENGIKAKIKLSPQEQRVIDVANQISPKVDQLKKLIEDNNLQGEGGFLASLKQKGKFAEYRMGMKPDQLSSDLIKAAAALQVMGAAPWMQIGRGKYLFETIVQHLPSPSDSPALLYDKVQFLDGIVKEARASMPNAGEMDQSANPDMVITVEDMK